MNRALVFAVGIASSALFLALALRGADLGDALAALRAADFRYVLLAAATIQLVYVAQALRWRVLVGSQGHPGRYVALILAGVGTNNLVPLRVGDLLRARWLAAREGMPTGRALGSVFRDRAADVVGLMLLMALTLPLVRGGAWAVRIALGGLVLLGLVAGTVGVALWYTRRRPRARISSRGRGRRFVRDGLDELSTPLGRRRMAVALLLSILAWSIWAASAGLVCASLGIDVSVVDVLFVTATINLGVVIPSSPGFVGTYQWLAVTALGALGVGVEAALAYAILMQAVWFVPTTIVGGWLALLELRNVSVSRRGHVGASASGP